VTTWPEDRRPVLLLDVGGVLLLPAATQIAQALAPWGAQARGADDATLHYEAVRAFDRTGDIRDYRRAYAWRLGLRNAALDGAVTAEEAWRRPWPVPIRAAVAKLRWLVEEGGTDVVIVSDSDGTAARQLADSGVCQVGPGRLPSVLAVCDSAIIGVSKPAPLIFKAALRAAGGSGYIIGHLGDSLRCDVSGASAAGVPPIHVDPLGWCPDTSHPHVAGLADWAGPA
jgi:putative hydrolase of the HAD superfamily